MLVSWLHDGKAGLTGSLAHGRSDLNRSCSCAGWNGGRDLRAGVLREACGNAIERYCGGALEIGPCDCHCVAGTTARRREVADFGLRTRRVDRVVHHEIAGIVAIAAWHAIVAGVGDAEIHDGGAGGHVEVLSLAD